MGLDKNQDPTGHWTHLNVVDMITVPHSAKHRIPKSKGYEILDHLLAEIMVDAKDLVFFPIRCQFLMQVNRAFEIPAEGLFDLEMEEDLFEPRSCVRWRSFKTYDDLGFTLFGVAILP